MLWLIVGLVVGAGLFGAVRYSRQPEVTVPWYSWVLGVLAVLFGLVAIEVFAGSLAESETRAAWMGFLAFAVPGVVLGALAWWPTRRGSRDEGVPAKEVEHASA